MAQIIEILLQWPGDSQGQGISGYGIEPVFIWYSSLSTKGVNDLDNSFIAFSIKAQFESISRPSFQV